MTKSRNLVAVLTVVTFCILLVMPAYGGDGCCPSKAKVKTGCTGKASADASGQSGCTKKATGCSKPCTKPCGGTMHGSLGTGSQLCKLTFGVGLMSGDGCAKAVQEAIKLVEGVQSVSVDQTGAVADVEFDVKTAGSAEIIQAIEKAGYTAQVGPYSEEELAEFAKGKKEPVAKSSSTM